ncbi:alkylated DNA repair protein alkB homolog 8 isoform X2 [Latimeria chalumnae]|uniref:tRNA (carboxymethyluridine(34)-5-O)-methyltransferase n=1 Tax=Latimeria chalumnae TaxID=7897 RepID=H3AJZ8_LATCH|nr:PREDICTED: alkylated DNA repair protein alkB homolog 8 isoform X2 [Latimeria chalumnae]|eukprot:XP_005999468.1 PREDICTED: alkylated DNA repair protein alkB homolog 8 isoform X2 [Latimeria chalumnae]
METISPRKVKLSKERKKQARKQIRAGHTLLKHEGIQTSVGPTQSLVVANGGLGNGVNRQQLFRLLQEQGTVKELLMPPNKPYAFVTFGTVEEARKAYSVLNGYVISSEELSQSITIYLNFVEKVYREECAIQSLPPGLVVVEDFISSEYELKLLENIGWCVDTINQKAQKTLKHRKVKHYGYEFRYDNNNVDKDKPLPGGLPADCNKILEKCLEQGYVQFKPDQLTINQYEPGQGIPPHIDTHSAFEDGILSLSLGAVTVMDFKHPDGRTVAVLLPQRSLLVMTGESRYLWSHGITPRKFDVVQMSEEQKSGTISDDIRDLTLNKRGTRTSFTFRKVRHSSCNCAYPVVCDSQSRTQKECTPSIPHSEGEASKLEQEYVHKVYEEIAGHFSSTRHTPWPKVVEFLKSLPKGALVADVGCGNGKYMGVNQELYMIGCDQSRNLVDICGERNSQAFVCNALSVPIRSGVCDACISIAVIHHFSTEERRLAAVAELTRLLRPGGKALIYVWAMEQEYNKQKSKYLKENKGCKEVVEDVSAAMVEEKSSDNHSTSQSLNQAADRSKGTAFVAPKYSDSQLSIHTNRTSFSSQDLLVPWHLKGGTKKNHDPDKPPTAPSSSSEALSVFHRYYHVFCEEELEATCVKLSNIIIKHSYYDQGNWCVILEKC